MRLSNGFFLNLRRGFAERPSSKKTAALKRLQNGKMKFVALEEDAKEEVRVVEVQLPPIGESLKNVTVGPVPADEPVLLPDSSYPDWVWRARGPCRASLRSLDIPASDDSSTDVAQLKKYLRTENRKSIRKNNSLLKGASQ